MTATGLSIVDGVDIPSALDESRVHVWRWSPRRDPDAVQDAYDILNLFEQARSEQMTSASAREFFILRRGALRSVLGAYLDLPARNVAIDLEPSGRPVLAPAHHDARLSFNVSHTSGAVMIAVSRGNAIGIDVERKDDEGAAIASSRVERRLVSLVEQRQHECLDGRSTGATGLWTGIEALVKATGSRLADDAALVRVARHEAPNYWIRWIPLEPGFTGAIAGSGPPRSLQILSL